MRTKGDIKTATLDEIEDLAKRGELLPRQPSSVAPDLPQEFWEQARAIDEKTRKTAISLRVDAETIAFFRNQGSGHLTRMANVLKAYARASKAAR